MVRFRIYIALIFGLILHFQGQSQDTTNLFVRSFKTYQTERPSQQLQFVFNQTKYAPGDTIFFKSYLLASNFTLWKSAQIVEVNLIDSQGKVRGAARTKIDRGIGFNQLILPTDLESGFYNFTAFTNWMRNFGEQAMYQHQIEVIKEASIDRIVRLEAKVEGGQLVANVPANIVVRTDVPADSLLLMDSQNNILAKTAPDVDGFAGFRITPKEGISYQINSSTEQIALPEVQREGFNLSLTKINEQFSRLRALGNLNSTPNLELTLVFSTRGAIYFQQQISARDPFQTNIDRRALPSGVHQISLLHPDGRLLAFREFYIPTSPTIRGEIMVQPNQADTRAELKIDVQLMDGNQPIAGEFSVSVLNSKAFDNAAFSSYLAEFFLEDRASLLPKNVSPEKRENVIDNILILNPKEMAWDEMIKPLDALPFYGLSSLYQLRGIARDSLSGEVLPVGSTLMVYLQKDLMRYEVIVGYEGRFELNLLDVFGEDELFVMAENTQGEEVLNVDIEWTNFPLPAFQSGFNYSSSEETDTYAEFYQTKYRIDKSFGFFNTSANLDSLADAQRMEAPKVPILEIDNSINVDDFYLFPTMSQFVDEVVRPLRVGQQKDQSIVRMKYLEPNIATGDPLYIIDGIATKNTDFFLSLNPKDLQTISVIKLPRKLARFGLMAKNGIVIVNSKLGNIREKLNPENLILGLNRALEFPALGKEWAQSSSNPEFRSTVYWNPSLKTDEQGKASFEFFTSDDEADLVLLIQGIADNQPLQLIRIIKNGQEN